MKRVFVLLLVTTLVVLAFPQIEVLSQWNKDLNPALVSWSARNFVELNGGLSSRLIQESLTDFTEIADLNLLGNEGNYYDLSSSNVLGRNVSFESFGKIKLGTFVLAPEFKITNIDMHNKNTLNFINSLWIDSGLHIGLRGKDFSFGGTIKSHLPIYDVRRSNNDYTLITAFPDETSNLPYTYSLFYDGPTQIFNELDTLMDKMMNNGIITLDVGFVAGNNYPAIGFGVKDIPIASGVGIYKYNTFAHVNFSSEALEFSEFDIVNKSDEVIWSKFKPWKMTFFITLPILLDFVPSIEYAPDTEDFIWGVAAGKRILWGALPFWAEIKNYNINADTGDSYNYWTFNSGIGLNIYLAEVHVSLTTQAPTTDELFDGRNTTIRANMSIGF